jgi:hypothetical protein
MSHAPIVPDARPEADAGPGHADRPGARARYIHVVGHPTHPEGAAMSGEAEPAAGIEETGGSASDRPTFDTTVAHSARVHDYWLGGKDNFAADRAAGDAVIAAYPGIVQVCSTGVSARRPHSAHDPSYTRT